MTFILAVLKSLRILKNLFNLIILNKAVDF